MINTNIIRNNIISAKDANKILEIVRNNVELQIRIENYLRELNNEIIRVSKNGLCETNLSIIATEKLHTTFDGPLKDYVIEELKKLGYFTDGLRVCWGISNDGLSELNLSEEEEKELIKLWNERKFTQEPREIKNGVIVYNKNAPITKNEVKDKDVIKKEEL
jgi:hypothetical protein